LRRFVAARQNDYASHAGALSYGAAVAPRYSARIEHVEVKRTFYIALSRLTGERGLVGHDDHRKQEKRKKENKQTDESTSKIKQRTHHPKLDSVPTAKRSRSVRPPTPVPDLRNAAVVAADRRRSCIASPRWIKPKQPRRRHSPHWRHLPPLRPPRTLHHSFKSVRKSRRHRLCHHSHHQHGYPQHGTGKGKYGQYGAVRGSTGQYGAILGSKGQKGESRDSTTEKKRAVFPDDDAERRPTCKNGTHPPTALQVVTACTARDQTGAMLYTTRQQTRV